MGLKNLVLPLILTGFSFIPGFSQNVIDGCDYIRRLKVNTSKNEVKEVSYNNSFLNYDNFEEPFEDEAKNSLEGKVMNIYFPTKSFSLTGRDSTDIRRYVLKVLRPLYMREKINTFNIEGFADFRGSVEDNHTLSCNRVNSVAFYFKELVRNVISPSIKIYVSAFGESKSKEYLNSEALKKDRVVKIIPNKSPLVCALENLDAKFYLLDQSGSMKKDGLWRCLQTFSFPDSSEVYSFSEIILPKGMDKNSITPSTFPECFHSFDINTEVASGCTPYYSATDKFISFVPPNNSVNILVNGRSNFGEGGPEDLIKKLKEKNLVLNMIGINLSEDFEKDLIKIASETKGNYYFLKEFGQKFL